MREYETYVLDTQAHMIMMPWWERIVPHRSYVKGWKISPSHYVNQDLGDDLARQIAGSYATEPVRTATAYRSPPEWAYETKQRER